MPISDLFIARRMQSDIIEWTLFDAFKLNYGYGIEISENGMIVKIANDDELKVVGANFSTARRQNLNGVNVTCGLVIAYPERFTYVDDPTNNHVDVFTKGSINLGHHLLQTLNIRLFFFIFYIHKKDAIQDFTIFSCQMYQTDSYGWPRNGTMGLFDGAIGLFQKKKIQMTSHGVNMRAERLKYVEFAGDIFTPRLSSLSFFLSSSKRSNLSEFHLEFQNAINISAATAIGSCEYFRAATCHRCVDLYFHFIAGYFCHNVISIDASSAQANVDISGRCCHIHLGRSLSTRHTLTHTNDIRPICCRNDIPCDIGTVHIVFGKYRCTFTESKQLYHQY